jgi:hypothetical protein
MAKSEQKLQAFNLRREGKSIKEISILVGVTKETVSMWCRDLVLTEEQSIRLREQMIKGGHKGRMIGAAMNRDKKLKRIEIANEEAREKIDTISTNELFYLGLGIYWGEGTKSGNGALAVSNSDPRVIQLMIRWFMECFGVSKADFSPRVFISDTHRDREEKIYDFWVEKLAIPRTQFKKMIFLDKGKKIYENREVYYGVLALRIAKGTDLNYKILALMSRIGEVGIMSG